MSALRERVAVVGAGPLGSASARHLAESGVEVTVFGPDEPAGHEQHRGTWSGHYDEGRIAATDPLRVASVLGHRAMDRYAEIEAASGIRFTRPHPQLMMFPAPAASAASGGARDNALGHHMYRQMDALLQHSREFGTVPEVLDHEALATRYPDLRFSPDQVGALQEDAIIVNPRQLVRAELALAEAAGATRVRECVTGLESTGAGVTVTLTDGSTDRFDRAMVAVGSGTNASGLLPRPVDTEVYGASIVLLEVSGPEAVDMPSWMYLDRDHHGGGLVTPPTRYLDGRWYLKCASGLLLDIPLRGREEIEEWVRTGGEAGEEDYFRGFVASRMPGVEVLSSRRWPCLPSINATDVPYIDLVDERIGVVVEGERGVMMADEIGRLGAHLLLTGSWDDDLDHTDVAVRWA